MSVARRGWRRRGGARAFCGRVGGGAGVWEGERERERDGLGVDVGRIEAGILCHGCSVVEWFIGRGGSVGLGGC